MTDNPTSACSCEQLCNDGKPCASAFEVAIVDVVRYEEDGSATFFTLPLCYGHRLALGDYVVHYEEPSRG